MMEEKDYRKLLDDLRIGKYDTGEYKIEIKTFNPLCQQAECAITKIDTNTTLQFRVYRKCCNTNVECTTLFKKCERFINKITFFTKKRKNIIMGYIWDISYLARHNKYEYYLETDPLYNDYPIKMQIDFFYDFYSYLANIYYMDKFIQRCTIEDTYKEKEM